MWHDVDTFRQVQRVSRTWLGGTTAFISMCCWASWQQRTGFAECSRHTFSNEWHLRTYVNKVDSGCVCSGSVYLKLNFHITKKDGLGDEQCILSIWKRISVISDSSDCYSQFTLGWIMHSISNARGQRASVVSAMRIWLLMYIHTILTVKCNEFSCTSTEHFYGQTLGYINYRDVQQSCIDRRYITLVIFNENELMQGAIVFNINSKRWGNVQADFLQGSLGLPSFAWYRIVSCICKFSLSVALSNNE